MKGESEYVVPILLRAVILSRAVLPSRRPLDLDSVERARFANDKIKGGVDSRRTKYIPAAGKKVG
jgi:hypothetical protein